MTTGDMLRGGARLVRTQPKALALWALLYLALTAAFMATFWPMMREMAAVQQAMVNGTDPASMPVQPLPGMMAAAFLLELALLVAIAAIFAAAVRAVASGHDGRFGHLRLGLTELRLVGLGILIWLMLVVAMVVYAIVSVLLTGLLSATIGNGAAGTVLLLVSLVAVALLIWAEVRLSLAGAFTVLRGRITLRPAWRATRGLFWPLFAAYLVIGIVYVAVSALLTLVFFPDLFSLYLVALRGADPSTILSAQQAMMANLLGPRMIVAMVVGTAISVALIGWLFGAIATAAFVLDDERRA